MSCCCNQISGGSLCRHVGNIRRSDLWRGKSFHPMAFIFFSLPTLQIRLMSICDSFTTQFQARMGVIGWVQIVESRPHQSISNLFVKYCSGTRSRHSSSPAITVGWGWKWLDARLEASKILPQKQKQELRWRMWERHSHVRLGNEPRAQEVGQTSAGNIVSSEPA